MERCSEALAHRTLHVARRCKGLCGWEGNPSQADAARSRGTRVEDRVHAHAGRGCAAPTAMGVRPLRARAGAAHGVRKSRAGLARLGDGTARGEGDFARAVAGVSSAHAAVELQRVPRTLRSGQARSRRQRRATCSHRCGQQAARELALAGAREQQTRASLDEAGAATRRRRGASARETVRAAGRC